MKPRIENLIAKKLVGIRLTMSLVNNRTGELWKTFMPRRREITNNLTNDLISMQVYQPTHFEDFSPTKVFEKWATVEVDSFDSVPMDMETFVLPSGMYAVFEYVGSSSDNSIFQYIFGTWLPNSEESMPKLFLLTALAMMLFCGCHKPIKLSPIEEHFNNRLRKEKSSANFEEDTEFGYIKIGNFLNADIQNAIVIRFDSTTTFSVYELKNDQWEPIYEQQDSTLSRAHSMEAYIEDYNFDGIKDIGIRNEVSNGAAIMSFHLWLAEGKTYRYVPEFEVIGNPIIVKQRHIVQGFSACCMFSELTLADYQWDHNKLINTSVLEIHNYPTGMGIEATYKDLQNQIESKIDISENEIAEIIDTYSTHWQLVHSDTDSIRK